MNQGVFIRLNRYFLIYFELIDYTGTFTFLTSVYLMKFQYQIQEKDYLDFQLYTASVGPRFQKKQTNGKYFLALCSLITTSYFLYIQDWGMVAYFGLTTLIFFLFYPRYFKWRQRVHYTKFIRRHYRSLFGANETLEVNGKNLQLENATGKGTIKNAEIKDLTEIGTHFFINLTAGSSLIIPKRELQDVTAFSRELKNLKLKTNNQLDWKW